MGTRHSADRIRLRKSRSDLGGRGDNTGSAKGKPDFTEFKTPRKQESQSEKEVQSMHIESRTTSEWRAQHCQRN
eukprot:3838626-Pleurochrysis_carterae.AAC.2